MKSNVTHINKGFTLANTSIVKLIFGKKTDQKTSLEKNKVINNAIADNFLPVTPSVDQFTPIQSVKPVSNTKFLPEKEVRLVTVSNKNAVSKSQEYSTRPKHWYEKEFKYGVRTIAGKDYRFRSSWENNFALYLQMLLEKDIITKWEYEPDIFKFKDIKKGTKGYLPDFKVTWQDGRVEFFEVKGYLDPKSKVKLKRFQKYFPDIPITVISTDWFNAMKSQKHKYKGWEE